MKQRDRYVMISLEIGFVLVCATICCIKNFNESSGEFWGSECIAVLGRSGGGV